MSMDIKQVNATPNQMQTDGVIDSKRAYRQTLAAKPIAEKLRMLDALRERALTIQAAHPAQSSLVRESSAEYRPKGT